MAGQLWVRLIKRARIIQDNVQPCPDGDWLQALTAACHALDLSVPMVGDKHHRDWAEHRQVRFLPEHFIDGLPCDRVELEYYDPQQRQASRRSQDPRNG